jgi:three-Cys-motif partner protein
MPRQSRPPSEYIPNVVDDNLTTPEVGIWAIEKYLRVGMYDQLVATGMKGQFHERVYVDLYSGAGHSRIKGTTRVLPGSPILALSVTDKFDRYIFCDEQPQNIQDLKKRVAARFADRCCDYIIGDANERVRDIIEKLPPNKWPRHKVLTFCFVDPFSLNIDFTTIEQLAAGRPIDFLILLAVEMDAKRNWFDVYLKPGHTRIEKLLGDPNWRAKFPGRNSDVARFILTEYAARMQSIGYKPPPPGIDQYYQVRSARSPLYYLGFFSKHERGYDYWRKVNKYSTTQPTLDLY